MRCPVCENTLTEMTVADVTVDVCQGGCGGIWLDQSELEKVDELKESAGSVLLQVERAPDVLVDHVKTRHCPRCGGVLERRFYTPKRVVEVDECPTCGGFWLDVGELAMIRSQYPSTERRRQEAHAYCRELFHIDFVRLEQDLGSDSQTYVRIVQMFRFICPGNS